MNINGSGMRVPPDRVPTRDEVDEFLAAFFSPPNKFGLSDVETGKAVRIRPWLERLRTAEPQPTVLPRWDSNGVTWYTITFSSEQTAGLSDILLAFIGPTFSTYRGLGEPLDPSDQVETLIQGFTSGYSRRFRDDGSKESRTALWSQLELMRRALERKPLREVDRPRPLSRVLRDFYMALAAGSATGAETYLRQLTERRDVDAANALFLRVQALAALSQWKELLSLEEFGDLLAMRRPVAVTEALLRAVYRVEVEPQLREAGVAGLSTHFAEIVRPKYEPLLSRRAGIRAPEAAVVLMLHATTGAEKDPALRDAMLALSDVPSDFRTLLQQLAARSEGGVPTVVADPLRSAFNALQDGDYDSVLSFATQCRPSIQAVRLLLTAAFELQSLEAESAALEGVRALSETDRAALLAGRSQRTIYDELIAGSSKHSATAANAGAPDAQGSLDENEEPLPHSGASTSQDHATTEVVEAIPSNWFEWLSRLKDPTPWPRALEVARQGAREWSVEELLERPNAVLMLTEVLAGAKTSTTLRNALPHLLTFWERDVESPRRELAPVYQTMFDLLTLDTEGADEDFQLAYDLLSLLLKFGPTASEYQSLVENVMYLLTTFSALNRIDWSLDVLDLLVAHHAPLPNVPVHVLTSVTDQFRRWYRRIEPQQWDLLSHLAVELKQGEVVGSVKGAGGGVSDNVAAKSLSEALSALNQKVVAIYSLTETVARRARDVIIAGAPDARVELSGDKVGSSALRSLARNADVFIIVTGSAKHAATEFIEEHRPKGDPTRVILRPQGRGVASILRVLFNFLLTGRTSLRSVAV